MEKINIAELLKDCPKGMELDCTMFEGLEFDSIVDNENFPIRCRIKNSNDEYNFYNFTKYGCWNNDYKAKCVIFPKGKTTWEGFHRPFKDGDILATDLGSVFYLNTHLNTHRHYGCYVGIGGDNTFHICKSFAYKECCGFATEEEKQKLFNAIKEKGYHWNEETKTLEKLLKFKVGNKIVDILRKHEGASGAQGVISEITDDKYIFTDGSYMSISNQDNWELVADPDKFDINTLVPFESRVLVRNSSCYVWEADIFGRYSDGYITLGGAKWGQCIPYEHNEHLFGTTNDCDDFYKTWEE